MRINTCRCILLAQGSIPRTYYVHLCHLIPGFLSHQHRGTPCTYVHTVRRMQYDPGGGCAHFTPPKKRVKMTGSVIGARTFHYYIGLRSTDTCCCITSPCLLLIPCTFPYLGNGTYQPNHLRRNSVDKAIFSALDQQDVFSAREAPMASSFPPPPVNTIDWANVGFRVREGKRRISHPVAHRGANVDWQK